MLVILSLLACPSRNPAEVPNPEGATTATTTTTGATTETTTTDTVPSETGSEGTDPCAEELLAPQARIWPEPGELFYAQIGLGGLFLGESALVVGPDGTRVLIDVGNDAHDDDVAAVLSAIGSLEVDHVVITHLHADHADGLEDLLGDVRVSGKIVHRGLLDLTEAANTDTVAQLCRSLALAPGASTPLCEGTEPIGCDPATWSGTYPSTTCAGLVVGPLQIVAINGHINGASYRDDVGPFLTEDLNGENARSAVGVVSHGDFRLLISGDLTAQSPDSDPVEEYYAGHILTAAGLDSRGVDVVHLAHHGRDSSNSTTWLDVLAPADGLSRNAVIGISTAHVGSPYRTVLDNVLAGGRLTNGRIWATTVAAGGATDPMLIDASGGQILIGTRNGGSSYAIQAIDPSGTVIDSRAYHSARKCAR